MRLYRLLTVDVGYYMPPYKSVNVYFLKALISGKKRAIKTNDVRHLYAPQYDSLSISKILEFASAFPAVNEYLPEARDIPALPRQWILNICFRIIGQEFADFVRSAVDNRHEKLAMRHDMAVEVDPEILAVIQASTHVSTMKGNSAHLLKIGTKRRRSKAEMIEFRKMREEPLEVIAAKDS